MTIRSFKRVCRPNLFMAMCTILIVWIITAIGFVPVAAEETTVPTPKQLKQAAYNSQWRLQRAIERDGFYSARVALNVWRSNAIDAGIFDQTKYDDFKKQIYEKSVQSNLDCFEISLEKGNLTDARICLYTWKSHSQELGSFDQLLLDEMDARLEEYKKNAETQNTPTVDQ